MKIRKIDEDIPTIAYLHRRLCVAAFGVLVMVLSSSVVHAETYETPASHRASVVIPAELREGKLFTVDPTVYSDGYLYLITVKSSYGTYRIRGLDTLRQRVYELEVLEQLEEFSDSKVFLDAAQQAGVDIVMAPVRGVGKVVDAVSNPDETWKKLKGVPSGIGRLFGDAVDTIDSGFTSVQEFVGDQFSSGSESKKGRAKKKGEKGKNDDLTDKAVDRATKEGLKYVGYSARESEWYERFELDQFTTNAPLRERITRVAAVNSAVKFSSRFLPGLGQLKLVSDINRGLSAVDRINSYKSPEEQRKSNDGMLEAMGCSTSERARFLDNSAFSPSDKTRLVANLGKLSAAKNRCAVIVDAARVVSPEVVRVFLQSIGYLTRNGIVVLRFLDDGAFPIAVAKDSRVIAPLALDYVAWTKEVAEATKKLRLAASKVGYREMEIHLAGQASPRTLSEAKRLGVVVTQRAAF